MNFLTKCASTDVSTNFAAMWMFITCIINIICRGTSFSIISSSCGETFDMENHKKIEVAYNGSDILDRDPCYVQFTKPSNSYKQYLCVYGDHLELDCETSLEYQEDFVKQYMSPEVKMSCNTSSMKSGEWCPSQYQDNVFIVIRKSCRSTSDNIKLRVYLKDEPDEALPSSGISTALVISLFFATVVLLCSCYGCIVKFCLRASTPRTKVQYETKSGNFDLLAGEESTSQYPDSGFNGTTTQAYQPLQSGFPGNYNVHPMLNAHPA